MTSHGNNGYKHGCRCAVCKEWKSTADLRSNFRRGISGANLGARIGQQWKAIFRQYAGSVK